MKYLFVLLIILFSGCASVSEYNQGCRDGIGGVRVDGRSVVPSEKSKNDFCNALDQLHKQGKQIERENVGN